MITTGSAATTGRGGHVRGWLIKFTSAADPDIAGLAGSEHREFFTKATDFGLGARTELVSPVFYDHGNDGAIGKSPIGTATLTLRPTGVWADATLDLEHPYAPALGYLAEKGALGWSSGSASHLVAYRLVAAGVREITHWPLGADASLTPTPAEPRTFARVE